VRTLKRIVDGFGCLLVAGVVVATSVQIVPEVIQAKSFEVVNGDGKVVASFYAYMGGGKLSFSNKDGEVVAGLDLDEDIGETNDLALDHPEILKKMQVLLGQWALDRDAQPSILKETGEPVLWRVP